ncbi:uncharacterized protein LOC100366649 [Saccoglossus kowalevskii]|uniref:Uncharacterized protein LOC100366649 n=1 Tax=Saccoglossus kowalevskii TaxID=10224 RepID=A0ABM0GLA0_SACKO|nr:PREDICTED: uncharacterized protein LOC100366649 [Saccoglossus kowalevskii]
MSAASEGSETRQKQANVCCLVCQKRGKILKRCTKCHDAFYCSRECQIQDWPSHRSSCKPLKTSTDTEKDAVKTNKTESNNCAASQKSPKIIQRTKLTDSERQNNVDEVPNDLRHSDLKCIWTDCKDGNMPTVNNSSGLLTEGSLDLASIEEQVDQSHTITIKHMKLKHKVKITESWNSEKMFCHVCDFLRIPVDKIKLVHKGKLMKKENLKEFVRERAVFQAFGEVAENEDDLLTGDVDLICKQLSCERNAAIRALRKTGNVVDAIFYIANA